MDMSHTALSLYDANSQRLYLNQDERCRFRQAAEKQPAEIRAFALTLFFTGCRISEACGLRASALQVASRTLSITCLKKRHRHVVRELPIPPELSSALADIMPRNGSCFWEFDGEQLPRITAYRWIKTIMADAGIQGVHACPKGLRHSYGVNATMTGVQIHMLQRWMGHASISTTAIYATAIGPEEQKVAARMWATAD